MLKFLRIKYFVVSMSIILITHDVYGMRQAVRTVARAAEQAAVRVGTRSCATSGAAARVARPACRARKTLKVGVGALCAGLAAVAIENKKACALGDDACFYHDRYARQPKELEYKRVAQKPIDSDQIDRICELIQKGRFANLSDDSAQKIIVSLKDAIILSTSINNTEGTKKIYQAVTQALEVYPLRGAGVHIDIVVELIIFSPEGDGILDVLRKRSEAFKHVDFSSSAGRVTVLLTGDLSDSRKHALDDDPAKFIERLKRLHAYLIHATYRR